jgi:protein involved in polysaccharide export with SLBB domain
MDRVLSKAAKSRYTGLEVFMNRTSRFPLVICIGILCGMVSAQTTDMTNAQSATKKNADLYPSASLQAFINTNQYVPNPGDGFLLTLFRFNVMRTSGAGMNETTQFTIYLKKDSTLEIPILGSIQAKGLTFDQLREKVIEAAKRKFSVDYIDFAFISPVAFEVFPVGLVKEPKPVIASSIMRALDVIDLAGGIAENGSSRNVVLERADGSKVHLDLYEYSKIGDPKNNPLILPGDKIFVGQPIKAVLIEGAVRKQGRMELLADEGLATAIDMAFGFLKEADRKNLRVTRVKVDGTTRLITVDALTEPNFPLEDGDSIRVYTASDFPEYVKVEGPFYGKTNDGKNVITPPKALVRIPVLRSTTYGADTIEVPAPLNLLLPYISDMNLYDVMESLGGPSPLARGSKGMIYRQAGGEAIPFDPIESWENPASARKIEIRPGDFIQVIAKNQVVTLSGEVNLPMVLPYLENRTIADYLAMVGGVSKAGEKATFDLVDPFGNRRKIISMDYIPQPEDIIYVRPNASTAYGRALTTSPAMGTLNVTLGFLTTLLTFFDSLGRVSSNPITTWLVDILTP